MRTTLYTSTNPDGTGNVRDPTETMYPPNISLGFGVPRKTKSRRLNNLMYFQKFSCISARSRVHFVDNSLNESIDCHVAPSFRKHRLVPDESWPICARHAGRDIMRTGGFQSKRSLGFCLGFWGIIRYVTRRTSIRLGGKRWLPRQNLPPIVLRCRRRGPSVTPPSM